jgi:hypothetical protein
MLFATFTIDNLYAEGHVGDEDLQSQLAYNYNEVLMIQVDGDELERACALLGRPLPPRRVYTFVGDNAKELARNWQ